MFYNVHSSLFLSMSRCIQDLFDTLSKIVLTYVCVRAINAEMQDNGTTATVSLQAK